MFVVKNSGRALLAALIPLAFLHGVLQAMMLAGTLTKPPIIAAVSPDQAFLSYLLRLALDGALIYGGHLGLRHFRISSRFAYAVMGGVMAAVGYAIALRNGWLLSPPDASVRITSGVLPAIAGTLSGFLYHQFAGLLPPQAVWPPEREATAPASPAAAADHHPDIFTGPVRVRTSLAALLLAGALPAALIALLTFSFGYAFLSGASDGEATWSRQILALALPAQMFLTTLFATMVPAVIFTLVAHLLARALNRRSGLEYAAIGAATGFGLAILAAPISPFTSLVFLMIPMTMAGGMMGALYRRFAGLEPMPLPEAVIVADENALVSADHPARRGHTMLFNG